MIQHISAVVLAKNNELTIQNTLQALESFNDVIVYDNGSTDSTMKIARSFQNVNLIQGEFKGFGWSKNEAISFAKHDWIIVVDSDEVIDQELLDTLNKTILDKQVVYKLNFKAYYKDIQIKHCGWSNHKRNRVFNKMVTKYNNNQVHEDIITNGLNSKILSGNIHHYSYQSISQFIHKIDLYSSLFAKNNMGKRTSSPLLALSNALYTFIRIYFFRLGILDGYAGLLVSFSAATVNFYKYLKLYEANKDL